MNLIDRNPKGHARGAGAQIDEVVSGLYRAAAELPSPADVALLRNASLALLRADTAPQIGTAIDIIDAVLLQLGSEALMPPITVRSLRESLSRVFVSPQFEPVTAH